MGTSIPVMGTKSTTAGARVTSVADALFSSTQQRVLGLLFGHPKRSFYATEIMEHVAAGRGAVQRELQKLVSSGLVRVARIGNQKHFQANPESPIFAELCALIRKTVGMAEPLRAALKPAAGELELALIYGSVAKGTATAASDIDLLLVSDTLTLETVRTLLEPVERTLERRNHPTLYTRAEFQRRLREGNPFLHRVLKGETLVLHGKLPDATG